MDNTFTHSGDLGDIIYSLPTIRAAGGGTLYLRDTPGKTSHGMTEAKVKRLHPLLIRQEYIQDVVWEPNARTHNLDGFRDHGANGNLCDMHLATHGFDWTHRQKAWIKSVTPRKTYPIVVHRSSRYWNENFPWDRIVKQYQGGIGFVGFEDEYKDFCNRFGEIPLIEANDFLELAQVIEGSEWFIGNQSSPLAVAHGMKHKVIMEISPGPAQHHCVFERQDCIIGWDKKIELPEVSQSTETVKQKSSKMNKKTALYVLGYNRPHYFSRLIDSLKNNDLSNVDLHLFLDGGSGAKQNEYIEIAKSLPFNIIQRVGSSGCGRNAILSRNSLFEAGYEQVLLLEDDVVVTPWFVNTTLDFGEWAFKQKYVGVASAFCCDRHNGQKDGSKAVIANSNWITYLMPRSTWELTKPLFDEFDKKFLLGVPYQHRNVEAIGKWQKKIASNAKPLGWPGTWNKAIEQLKTDKMIAAGQDAATAAILMHHGLAKACLKVNRCRHKGEIGIHARPDNPGTAKLAAQSMPILVEDAGERSFEWDRG